MRNHKNTLLALTVCLCIATGHANTLHVGTGQAYTSVSQAANAADPGDTVLIHNGTYQGTFWIENCHGSTSDPIVIRGETRASTIFLGGSESMHFSEASNLRIENMTITGQTGNGMNIDDGGTYDTPTHHIVIQDVDFFNMSAAGNNDMLKLSGLDDFQITGCTFKNGAAGGSGIDMVGCHRGLIELNTFENQGSNCIQAKGGTQFLMIRRNLFRNGGQRGVNLGGSTGLEFFRPIDATFEAADLKVFANVFVGCVAPVAYVGCVRVDVCNNTIIDPTRWVFRILQETVNETRFEPCGTNVFRNNLVWYSTAISTQVNIGGNTAPETFILANNLWYNATNPSASNWSNPQLLQTGSIYGEDPLLATTTDFSIPLSSPAVGKGMAVVDVVIDYAGKSFANPPSIGAWEGATTTRVEEQGVGEQGVESLRVFPNPSSSNISITLPENTSLPCTVSIVDVSGKLVISEIVNNVTSTINVQSLSAGVYFVNVRLNATSTSNITPLIFIKDGAR